MPIQLILAPDDTAASPAEFTEDQLFTSDGRLTLEAEVLARYMDTLDFGPLFDHPDVRPFVQVGPVLCDEEDDGGAVRLIPVMADGAPEEAVAERDVIVVEYIDGADAAAFIDEADLSDMLEYYLRHEHPRDTLEDRTAVQLFADVLGEGDDDDDDDDDGADVTERAAPFKKGNFRSGPMAQVSGKSKGPKRKIHGQRVRMMLAMLHKGVIARVPKGTGYKGGDYKKAAGYGAGTDAGRKVYDLHARANKKNPGKIGKLVDPGRRRVVQLIYKNLGASMPKNWVPPERRGGKSKKVIKGVSVKGGTLHKKGAAHALFGGTAATAAYKGYKGKSGAKGSHQVASVQGPAGEFRLHEGAGLAAAVVMAGRRKASAPANASATLAGAARGAVNG